MLRLALIGVGIERSWAPRLHREAGLLCGLEVDYVLRDPGRGLAEDYHRELNRCVSEGRAGVNVTHPFKAVAAASARIEDEQVRRLGAVNTLRLGGPLPGRGFNTDHSGFVRAYQRRFGDAMPGVVAVIGAGGVGRPLAVALAGLGARALRIVDPDGARAARLAADLGALDGAPESIVCEHIEAALDGADGVVNCSPVGMAWHPGTPAPALLLRGCGWAFDAVYTPRETVFLADAARAGLEVLSGYELFLYQGIDAFEIFSAERVEEIALRRALERPVERGPAALD